MKFKISELPEDEAKQYIYDAYMAAVDAHEAGELDTEGGKHPSKRIFAWHNLGRERDAAARDADMDNPDLNVADADNPEGSPDPKPTTNTGVPKAEKKLTADGQLDYGLDGRPRFYMADGRVLEGAAAIAAAEHHISDDYARRMEPAVPGYSRLK
jgi:hypothetical protein